MDLNNYKVCMTYNEHPIMILRLPSIVLWLHIQGFTQAGKNKAQKNSFINVAWEDSTLETVDVFSTTPVPLPFFEDSSNYANVTVQIGFEVHFSCKVNDLTDKTTVSWLRRHEGKLNLISVGMEIYSSDQRYSALFREPNDWQLHLQNVNEGDEGHYECQVSSHPPIVFNVFLHVVVPELEIADERGLPIKNKFYDRGSTIQLKCVITNIPKPTHFILWRHNAQILNYDTTRGGISVKTDILVNGGKSNLYVNNVQPLDSGNYTCSLAEAAATYVTVHVLNGETPAAMQHGGSSQQLGIAHLPALLFLVWTVTRIR